MTCGVEKLVSEKSQIKNNQAPDKVDLQKNKIHNNQPQTKYKNKHASIGVAMTTWQSNLHQCQ